MVFGYFIGVTYCKISVVHEYRPDTFLRTLRDGAVSFSAIISYGARRFFSKKFSSPPAMPYDKFCTVPKKEIAKEWDSPTKDPKNEVQHEE